MLAPWQWIFDAQPADTDVVWVKQEWPPTGIAPPTLATWDATAATWVFSFATVPFYIFPAWRPQ